MSTKQIAVLVAVLVVALMASSALIGGPAQAAGKSQKVKSFCDYGVASSTLVSGSGGGWIQTWGQAPVPELTTFCEGEGSLFDAGVVGLLTTQVMGAPLPYKMIKGEDWPDLVMFTELEGQVTWTEEVIPTVSRRGHGCLSAEIRSDDRGVFVFDADVEHADQILDEENNLVAYVIKFGAALDPDLAPVPFYVTEASGSFSNIKSDEPFLFYVSGEMRIAAQPDDGDVAAWWAANIANEESQLHYLKVIYDSMGIPLIPETWCAQANITVALFMPQLTQAHEDIMLTGSYYRAGPGTQK